jgi:PhzF family phenazine biosynthesis protein
MRVPIFQLDAFTNRRFAGNPAAVLVLERFPEDALLQRIAAENNLAETAFLVADAGDYRLRWFTPKLEVPLCGHATLASAAVVLERLEPGRTSVTFHTASGPLPVTRSGRGYVLDFPARPSVSVASPSGLAEALGAEPAEVFENTFNYLARFEDERQVRALAPDFVALSKLPRPGVIVSAPGAAPYDFVSRYFAPAKGINEDPVTGAAHCMLAPVWAKRLGKTSFRAFQASARGGALAVRLLGERVELEGECVFYLEGSAEVGER